MNVNILHLKRVAKAVLLFLLLSVVGMTNALALDFTEGNLTYTVNDGGTSVTVTGHADGTAATGALDIPESVTHGAYTYAVTDIEDYAFSNCTGITSVTIPSTMTSIGYAFSGCSGLLSVNYNATNCTVAASGGWYWEHWLSGCSSLVSLIIGENVQVIPNHFVDGCGSLVGMLTIPNSVTSIGYDAFCGCSGFAAVSIGNSVTSIGSEAFWNCSGIVSVSIPNSVTTIGYEAFYGCSSLTSVTIPNSITSIEQSTFYGCSSLASVSIGNGVASIESDAFANCTSLTSVSLPNSLVSIGNYAFSGCGNLPSITIPDAVLSIGESAFEGCGLNSVSIGSSVASIGNSAFSGCGFTSVTIPNSVVSIGNSVFSGCGNLASVILGTSVYSIGDYVFSGCSSLTSIEIPASVASIGTGAFQNCIGLGQITVASGNPILDSRDNCNAIIQTASNKLIVGCKNTVIPSTVTIIGEQAFYGCTGLTSITLPDDLTSIEDYAFLNCTGISSVTIPSAVTSIGFDAFSDCTGLFILNYNATNCVGNGFTDSYFSHWLSGCSSLVSLNIGENVQTIPAYFVCNNCGGYNLAGMLTIPNSVTSIGSYAFFNCHGFTAVTIGNSVTSIGDWAFASCTSLVSVSIPNSVVLIGGSAFASCTSLVSVTLPSSLTSIGEFAFGYCDNLDSISIPDAVVSIGHNAFYSCDNLTFLSLGSALASIGSEAFLGCNNLGVIIDHAETPPYLGRDAFSSVSANIPVYVPCEGVEAYVAANWGGFSNIVGMCAGEITVTANPAGGGMVSGGGSYEGGATCTLSASSYGYLPFLYWTKNGEVVSTNPNYSFIVTGDASYVANFGQINGDEFQIGSGTATNNYLPSYSYYNYSLTQQIYTATEMGSMAGAITSIAFYNDGAEKTRSYDIYLVNTQIESFSDGYDWIAVTADNLVFSGDVTMTLEDWTTITLDSPFNYDGTSNLALIVDDNTGSYSNSPHMACCVFNADGNQAIRIYNDNTNYDPTNPSSYSGTLLSVKNQIKLEIASMIGDNIEFADEAVKALCVANWDTDGDGELSYVEAAAVTDLGTVFKNNTTITSFDELQYFTGLTAIAVEAFYGCSNLASVGIPVTVESIGNRAFNFCSNLVSIAFPDGVTSIGSTAFWNCSALASVVFGNNVASIGSNAFLACHSLTSVEIPASVMSIGESAFSHCPAIEQMTVAEGNNVYDSRNNCNAIIETATNTLVAGCKNSVILNTVTAIGDEAFLGCSSLVSINIPNSVVSIGEKAFGSCSAVEQITVAEDNAVLDSRGNCNAIIETSTNKLLVGCQNTVIPNTVTAIGEYAFYGCSNMTTIEIPDLVETIGDYAFNFCSHLTAITIPDNVTTIGMYAFWFCSNLMSVEMGDAVATVGNGAFMGCPLTSLELPASIVSIGNSAFYSCSNLERIIVRAATPPTLGGDAFENVNTEIPVHVLCGYENAYSTVSWGGFSNFIGMCPVEITATANPSNGGTVSGAGTYNLFETCTLTATPNEYNVFINWTKNGEEIATTATYSFTVTEAAEYVANFVLNSYEITATANPEVGGTVEGAGTYNHYETCTLTATPNEHYTFDNWMLDGEEVSTNTTYTFTVTEAGDYVANFELDSYAITATANLEAGGTVTGGGTYDYGTTAILIATANEGYSFINWTQNGTVVSTDATYSFTVTEASAFVANFALNSYEVTTTASPTEGGVTTGTGTYDHGTTVTLTATANVGYTFINWTLDGEEVSTNITYTFTVTEASAFVANFELNSYEVTVEANPSEGGTTTGGGTFDHFTTCTLTATANEGYNFVNWTKDGTVVSTSATYSFTVLESAVFVANFELNSYAITATANPTIGGTVTGGGTYNHFATATLTAMPNPGYRFVNWTKDGTAISANPTLSITVTEAADYVANFETYNYTITTSANPSVGGTVIGGGTYNHFATCTLTATPNTGYSFVNWTKNGEVVSTNPTYSFTVTEAGSFVANFSLNGYEIIATVSPSAGGTVTGGGTFNHGQTCTLTATAATGYHFLNWMKDGSVISTEETYTFTVTEAGTYVANFELNSYTITATANPETAGTVMGGGTYTYGETATLTATPNEYCFFSGWTENGLEVSTDATYSFTVTGDRDLVANFTLNYHWDVNIYAYSSTMTYVGIIQINGVEQATNELEIGAFCNGECRGRERLTDQYYSQFGRYFVFLTVYGEDGDEISFRLYDRVLNEELDLNCAPMTFAMNATYGNPNDPYVFNFVSSEITQSTGFANGWNWWSSYIEGEDLLGQLKDGLGTNGQQIKSQTQFTQYNSMLNMWVGQLNTVNNESTYMVLTNNACTVDLTGAEAQPADHPITLNHGWNWIGYPTGAHMLVSTAFSNITPVSGDQVKSQNGFAQYNSLLNMWVGNLNTIHPGMGLLYQSNANNSVTLVYPEAVRNAEWVENITNENNYWTNDIHAYPNNMTVTAVVELDDVELQSEHYEVAAFANGECRGSARLMYVAPLNRYMAFLTIAGDEASELHFGLYDAETGNIETCHGASLQYETNAIVGDAETPYVISFRSTTGIDELGNRINVFPNPVARGENITIDVPSVETLRATSVNVEIINALGQVVETVCTPSAQTIAAPKVAGVYTLRITVEGKGTYCRRLVVR